MSTDVDQRNCPNCGRGVLSWAHQCPGCDQVPWNTEAGRKLVAARRRKAWFADNLFWLAVIVVVGGSTICSIINARQAAGRSQASILPAFDPSAYRGQYVVLNFWSSSCEFCEKDIDALKLFYAAMQGSPVESKRIAFVGVNLDPDHKKMMVFLQRHSVAWPQVFDGQGEQSPLKAQYSVSDTPSLVLLSPSGEVLATDKTAWGIQSAFNQQLAALAQPHQETH